jgi:hypothetical protein
LASGLDEGDITDDDLKRAVNDRAKQFLGQEVSGCVRGAATPAEKRACADRTRELKEVLAATKGKSRDEIKDSHVSKFVRESREDSALIAMKACGKTTNKTLLIDCREGARRAMADASGKDKEQINDFDIDRDQKSAIMRDVARLMDSCMRPADTPDKFRACKGAVDEMLNDLNTVDFKGRLPNTLENAAKAAVKEATELCDGDCSQKVRAAIARAKGKPEEDVTKLEERATREKAAKAASIEDARACKEAREVNATATCDGFYEKFLKRSGKVPPKGQVEEAAARRKVTHEVVESEIKDTVKVCFTGPKDELKKCLAEGEEYSKETVDFVMKEGGINDPEKRRKKEEFAVHKAKVATLGELFRACMLAVNATHEDCKVQLKEIKNGAEIEDTAEDILDGFYSFSLLKGPVSSCNETEMKDCRRDAKAQCLESGMKRRRLIVMQKLAQIRASAEELAYCLEGMGANDDNVPKCWELTYKIYKSVRGVSGKNFNVTLAKIKDLGWKIADGKELKLRRKKQVEVHMKTNETECDDQVLDEFKKKTSDVLYAVVPASEVLNASCEMVDDEPEYGIKAKVDLPDDQVEDAAKRASDAWSLAKPRRLLDQDGSVAMLFRRLADIDIEAFGAQSIDEDGKDSKPPPGSCIKLSMDTVRKMRNHGFEPASCNQSL